MDYYVEEMVDYAKEYWDEGHTLRMSIGLAYEDVFGNKPNKKEDVEVCDYVKELLLS